MQTITTIGLDIAKSVFQVHGVDAGGQVIVRRQLKRRYVLTFFQKLSPCLVGIEACGSSHHWSRELQALGHTVRLIPPAYVKPYVKRQKNDATDAEAICEAVTRANMRFVPTKTPEQQSGLVLHRTRHLFIRQRTSVINAIRAHLAEFGIVAPVGRHGVEELLTVVADPNDKRVSEIARACLLAFGAQLRRMKEQILEFDRLIRAWHRSNEMSMRLEAAPGVGPVLATALVAAVADPKSFRSGRNFSAWIGMVPKQHSSGGKNRLGNISKQGDRYLRGLFVAGALSVIRYAKIHGTKHRPWLTALLARRPTKVAAIALANKIARMVWAMMARGERYKEPVALAR
jgi:transposase